MLFFILAFRQINKAAMFYIIPYVFITVTWPTFIVGNMETFPL